MPWAVPESLIVSSKVTFSSGDVVIFGGGGSPAYDVRNWCRQQDGIINFDNSGVENKKLSNKEYFTWLAGFNAVVAAGSSNPMYDLVTPKYFEIAAAGALLIGQHCRDLELLGFNESNCIIFTQKDFAEKIRAYKQNPSSYKATREKGRELIRNRHTISHRIRQIQEVFGCRP
ncbi:MAG: glycosyltransferase [Deltaproteobacteria bacterium]|nr:glycosyltransferase [Deltaproteobacteria bacterium]